MTRLTEAQAAALAKGKPPVAKESEIQAAIKAYLQYRGWLVIKIHQSLGSYRGIADLYALKNGRHVWIEVKTAKGRLSKDQEKFRDEVEAYGGVYIVARSVEDVEHLASIVKT